MKRKLAWFLLLALGGCGSEAVWNGTYSATGTWKLSGPLEGGRTVGDAAADLLLDQLAAAAPVPSFLEDDLRGWLSDAIRERVKSTVDAKAPKDLAPGGSLTKLLGETLATVQLESTIVLEGDSDQLEGSETVTAVEYVVKGQRRRIAAGELTGQAGVGIVASWAGEESGAGDLSIEPHSVAIRYGELVRRVMSELLVAAELGALDNDLRASLGCAAIVAAILGGSPGLQISLAGWSHTIGQSDLEAVCNAAMSLAAKRAAGQFELDSRVEVGGGVTWTMVPGTQSIELKSAPSFGGIVNVLPKAIAPHVGVSFTATRQGLATK